MRRYRCYYGGETVEVGADTAREARELAVQHFKPGKNQERLVHAMLCGYSLEDDMVEVKHCPERVTVTAITGESQVRKARLIALKHALHLETVGMKRRGRSVYAIVREEFGLKGSRERVYEQFKKLVDEACGLKR